MSDPTDLLAIRLCRPAHTALHAVQLTESNLGDVAEWMRQSGTDVDQTSTRLAFPPPWAAKVEGRLEHAEPGDWVMTVDPDDGFWMMGDAEYHGMWHEFDAADLPEGVYARIELPGYRNHTGFITEETRFGVVMAVVRAWDGATIAEVAVGPGCQIVRMPVPLSRPPVRAIALPGPMTVASPWNDEDEDDDDVFVDSAGVIG